MSQFEAVLGGYLAGALTRWDLFTAASLAGGKSASEAACIADRLVAIRNERWREACSNPETIKPPAPGTTAIG